MHCSAHAHTGRRKREVSADRQTDAAGPNPRADPTYGHVSERRAARSLPLSVQKLCLKTQTTHGEKKTKKDPYMYQNVEAILHFFCFVFFDLQTMSSRRKRTKTRSLLLFGLHRADISRSPLNRMALRTFLKISAQVFYFPPLFEQFFKITFYHFTRRLLSSV